MFLGLAAALFALAASQSDSCQSQYNYRTPLLRFFILWRFFENALGMYMVVAFVPKDQTRMLQFGSNATVIGHQLEDRFIALLLL